MSNPQPEQLVQVGRPERVDPIVLDESEGDLLVEVVTALAQAVPPDRRDAYDVVSEQVRAGTIAPPQIGLLERILEMSLSSGRVRHTHRAEGERIVQGVFRRTPRGRAIDAQIAQANAALAVLAGQHITGVRASSRIPGHQTLIIQTENLELNLEIDANGVHVKSASL